MSIDLRTFRLLAAALLALMSTVTPAADVEYTYDEAGRLVGVMDPNGDAAEYVYDPAGNITEIKRFASTVLSLIEFQPKQGPIGTQVTIWGSGYSTTPANNAVTFNGTAATVSSATKNKLIVTVPGGATTGNLSITVSGTTVNRSGIPGDSIS